MKPACLLILLFVVGVNSASAYYDDVHYALTYYIARQSGYTHLQAYRIASAASMVDWDPETEPVQAAGQARLLAQADTENALIDTLERAWLASKFDFRLKPLHMKASDPRWKFHAFRNDLIYREGIGIGSESVVAQGAVTRQVAALFEQALKETRNPGVFLHAFQDVVPHSGYGTSWGHNPFTPDTFAHHIKNKLTVGSTTDWISARPTNVRFLCEETNSYLIRFMNAVSPHQYIRPYYSHEYEPMIAQLSLLNPAPESIKTDLQRQLFIRHFARKSGVDLDNYKQYTSTLVDMRQLSLIASDLGIGLSQEDYEKHRTGPVISRAVKAVNAHLERVGITDELPEHHLKYDLDAEGRLASEFQADDWTLVGSLNLTTAGEPATATLKMQVRDSRGVSKLNNLYGIPPQETIPGTRYRWDNLPIGDLVVEFKLRDGKTVRKDITLKKRVNDEHFFLGEVTTGPAGTWEVTVNYQNYVDRLRWKLYNEGRQAAGFYITRTLVGTNNPARQRFAGQSLGQTDIRPLADGTWRYEQTGGATWYKASCRFSGDAFTCTGSTWDGSEPITIRGFRSGTVGGPPSTTGSAIFSPPTTPAWPATSPQSAPSQAGPDVWSGTWSVNLRVPNASYVLKWETRKEGTTWRIMQTIVSTDNRENQGSVGYRYEAIIQPLTDGSFQFTSSSAANIAPGMPGYFRQTARCTIAGKAINCQGTQQDGRSMVGYPISFSGSKAGSAPTN